MSPETLPNIALKRTATPEEEPSGGAPIQHERNAKGCDLSPVRVQTDARGHTSVRSGKTDGAMGCKYGEVSDSGPCEWPQCAVQEDPKISRNQEEPPSTYTEAVNVEPTLYEICSDQQPPAVPGIPIKRHSNGVGDAGTIDQRVNFATTSQERVETRPSDTDMVSLANAGPVRPLDKLGKAPDWIDCPHCKSRQKTFVVEVDSAQTSLETSYVDFRV
ncbi:MAG: hypothetical protein Q9159_006230 [Coniocarpon cinnabarinum]